MFQAAVTRAEHLTQHYVWNQSLKVSWWTGHTVILY